MENERQETTALVAVQQGALTPATEQPLGYWARTAHKYQAAALVLTFVLVVFLVVFSVLSAHAFSYDSLFYFGKDLSTLASLVDAGEHAVYYDYEGERALPVAYRGGIAVTHEKGVNIYAADGQRLLAVTCETAYTAPRIATSRDYLVHYDFGGTAFCVCNSYDKLYEGSTEQPIYGVFVSDSGYFSIITASTTALSEVLLFDADFNLVQRFGRASATVGAVISDNGRTVTLMGAVSTGTVVDVYMIGDEAPLSSTALAGFPLFVDYTSISKLAILTDAACYALSTEGKLYETVSFDGAALAAYSIDQNGIAVALETDRLQAQYRVLVLDKKGNIEADVTHAGRVKALSLSDDNLWLLGEAEAVCIRTRNGEVLGMLAVGDEALDIVALGDTNARVLYPAAAFGFYVKR